MEDLQASAPADTTPIEQPTESQPQEPVTDEGQDEAPKPKKHRSAREALEKAFAGGSETTPTAEEKAAAEAKAEPKKVEVKEDPKGPQRAPDGKFAAKEGERATEKPEDGKEAPKTTEAKADHNAPPSRFSGDAKAEWEKAPESIRAETHRAIREMEKGIKEKDQALKPLEPFIKMAREQGTTVDKALSNYVQMEQMLRQNPQQGLQRLAQNMGMAPIHLAATALGVNPQALHQMLQQGKPQGQQGQPDPRDQQIAMLQQELQGMKQQFGQVSQTVQQQRQQAALDFVERFAANKPRFEELSEEILRLIDTGYATDLEDAYTKAERLIPAPQPAPTSEPTPAPPAQTRPARSLTGAPSPGSNPTTQRTPAKNPRDALKRHLFG